LIWNKLPRGKGKKAQFLFYVAEFAGKDFLHCVTWEKETCCGEEKSCPARQREKEKEKKASTQIGGKMIEGEKGDSGDTYQVERESGQKSRKEKGEGGVFLIYEEGGGSPGEGGQS